MTAALGFKIDDVMLWGALGRDADGLVLGSVTRDHEKIGSGFEGVKRALWNEKSIGTDRSRRRPLCEVCGDSWNGMNVLGLGVLFIPVHFIITPVTHSACISCSAGLGPVPASVEATGGFTPLGLLVCKASSRVHDDPWT